jgi:hypothetical protein
VRSPNTGKEDRIAIAAIRRFALDGGTDDRMDAAPSGKPYLEGVELKTLFGVNERTALAIV